MKSKKIVILGVNGTSFDFIYPWIKKGVLTNFEKALNKGSCGSIKAAFPPLHSVEWASILTGKNQSKHGIHGASVRDKAATLTFDDIKSETILDIIEHAGKKSIFLNVPLSNVSKFSNAIIINRVSALESDSGNEELFVHPDSLKSELKKNINNYDVYVEKDFDSRKLSRIVNDLFKSLEAQTSAILYMLKNKEYDLLTAVFHETDKLFHLLWKFSDRQHPDYDEDKGKDFQNTIIDFFKKLDEKLGKIMDAIDKTTTLFIVSDFGVSPIKKFLDVNAWLVENGYLALKESSTKTGKSVFIDSSTIDNTPSKFRLAQLKGDSILKKRFEALQSRFIPEEDIDWSNTKAFSTGAYGQVYINLKGKYPHGIVDDKGYKELLDEIELKLTELRDPADGHEVVFSINKKDNQISDLSCDAPDITIVTDNLRYYPFSSLYTANLSLYQDVFSTFTGHNLSGLVMAIGPEIKSGALINYAHLIDIVPTILYLLGLDIPNDIDGKVLKGAIKKSYLKKKKVLNTLKTAKVKEIIWGGLQPAKAEI